MLDVGIQLENLVGNPGLLTLTIVFLDCLISTHLYSKRPRIFPPFLCVHTVESGLVKLTGHNDRTLNPVSEQCNLFILHEKHRGQLKHQGIVLYGSNK